jgi:hypothetical protein
VTARRHKRLLSSPSNLINRVAFAASKDIAHAIEYGLRWRWHKKTARVFPSSDALTAGLVMGPTDSIRHLCPARTTRLPVYSQCVRVRGPFGGSGRLNEEIIGQRGRAARGSLFVC